ncbi:MAG: GumC family protein [Persicimonas sp.]
MAENLEIQEVEAPMPSMGGEGESLSHLLARYWALLKKYYWLLILLPALTVAAAFFWTQEQPKIYEAQSKIMFRQPPQNVLGEIERVEMVNTGGQWGFEQFWNTQKEVFDSQWFSKRVIQNAGLLDEEGFLSSEAAQLEPEEKLRSAAKRLQGMTNVELKPGTRVVMITASTTDPKLAALVSDALAEEYVAYIDEQQSGGLDELVTWFDNYVSDKRKQLEGSQRKLHQFKRDENILSLSYENRQNQTAASMESIQEQLLTVRGKLFEEQALLNQISSMESGGTHDTRAIADLVDNTTVNSLVAKESELNQKLAVLKTRYGQKHPEIQEVEEEFRVVTEQIQAEIDRIRSGVENRVAVLQRNQTQLESELMRLKEDIFELNELGLQYNQLTDRAENQKQLYDTVLKRSSELDINSMYDSDLAQVLEDAEEPKAPVSPNLPLNLAIGLGLGLAFGAGTIVLIDALDTSIRSKDDVARYTHKPILAMLPRVSKGVLKGIDDSLGDSALDTLSYTAPKSSFAEGIKTLRTNLMFMAPDNPPKLLLVTSPGPSEGKTLSSVNMAIAMAQSGQKTLIIDSDMRRPRIHKALGVENDGGLSTIITGQAGLDDVLKQTEIENLDVLTCGAIPPNPSELLHAGRFRELVEELREKYDRVIFDSPPLAAVSDALVLSHQVDSVLLILKFGQTRRELLRRSIEQLDAIGAPFMGCVLNDIQAGESAYAYSYYYRYQYEDSDSDKPSQRMAS